MLDVNNFDQLRIGLLRAAAAQAARSVKGASGTGPAGRRPRV